MSHSITRRTIASIAASRSRRTSFACDRRRIAARRSSATRSWESAGDRSALPFDALEALYDATSQRVAPGVRAPVVPGRASAARGRRRSHHARARRLHLRYRGDDGDDVVVGSVSIETRGLSGLHALRDCLPAIGRCPRVVYERLLETAPPPGMPRRVGADASHAWLTFYCPGHGLDRHRSH